jgi:hypothetical protein
MNAHTLRVLEYDAIRQKVMAHCTTPMGVERARQMTPRTDEEAIRLGLQQTSEARRLIDLAEELPLRGVQDVRSAASLAQAGGNCYHQNRCFPLPTRSKPPDACAAFCWQEKRSAPRCVCWRDSWSHCPRW